MRAQHDPANWYVIRTKPRQESRADANLRAWGVETLAPRICESPPATRGRRRSPELVPLFPGYMFARFDAATLISKVRLTRGVHSVIGFGECATPVDDDVVTLIRGRLAEDGVVRIADPSPGDTVEIVEGPLRSLVGVFERHTSGAARVLVLLTTLNAPVHVQLPKAHIRKAVA